MTREFLLVFTGMDSKNHIQIGNYYGSIDGPLTASIIEGFKADWATLGKTNNNCYLSPENCNCISVIPLEQEE